MKQLAANFWNSQAYCLATLGALGAAGLAAGAALSNGGSWYMAAASGLAALGVTGTTAHVITTK